MVHKEHIQEASAECLLQHLLIPIAVDILFDYCWKPSHLQYLAVIHLPWLRLLIIPSLQFLRRGFSRQFASVWNSLSYGKQSQPNCVPPEILFHPFSIALISHPGHSATDFPCFFRNTAEIYLISEADKRNTTRGNRKMKAFHCLPASQSRSNVI